LRVGRVFQPEAAARITFAGQQHIAKTLRLAKRVAAFQQLHQRSRAKFSATVNVAVFARHHIGQLAAIAGIRTLLNYFLTKEIAGERAELEARKQAAANAS